MQSDYYLSLSLHFNNKNSKLIVQFYFLSTRTFDKKKNSPSILTSTVKDYLVTEKLTYVCALLLFVMWNRNYGAILLFVAYNPLLQIAEHMLVSISYFDWHFFTSVTSTSSPAAAAPLFLLRIVSSFSNTKDWVCCQFPPVWTIASGTTKSSINNLCRYAVRNAYMLAGRSP